MAKPKKPQSLFDEIFENPKQKDNNLLYIAVGLAVVGIIAATSKRGA